MAQQLTPYENCIVLCDAAFQAEHNNQLADAYNLHGQAADSLSKLITYAKYKDDDEKRFAQKQFRFHTGRKTLLSSLKDKPNAKLSVVLPTALSAKDDLERIYSGPRGSFYPISLDELLLSNYETQRQGNPQAQPNPAIEHLLGQPVPPFITNLDPKTPPTSYHIYYSFDTVGYGKHMFYYKAKSPQEPRQTLYVLRAFKRHRYQIPETFLHRSTEFSRPCARVIVTPVSTPGTKAILVGRPLQVFNLTGRPILDQPDRLNKPTWGLRRFTYGGRQFVWMEAEGIAPRPLELYEVDKVWPKPGSKTGKKEHSIVGHRISWGESKWAMSKAAIIYIAGGVDQLFREYILAVQMTVIMVKHRGHQ